MHLFLFQVQDSDITARRCKGEREISGEIYQNNEGKGVRLIVNT